MIRPFFLFLMIAWLGTSFAKAQNPVTPPGVYLSDPSAREWNSKLYIYGSKDQRPGYFCSQGCDVLSTSDLSHWTISPNTFSTKEVRLWAPDCMEKNGTYYQYYCLSNFTEGVATAKSPVGPFTNGKPINLFGHDQIDPCVFKDNDGQCYYIWGQFHAYVAKLKANMTEIDSTTIHDNVVTEAAHHFHEGASMVKRKGIYYMVYTDISRAGMPTCIGYATARSPFGPFKYQGVIIDNNHCDPGNWNNHGCLVKFKDQWYVVYHRSSQNSASMRRTCMEPITFRKDGTIPEVEMTTQGVSKPLPVTDTLLAGRACLLFGSVYVDRYELTGIKNNDKVVYKYLDFKQGADGVTIRVAPGASPGTISIALDQLWHGVVTTVYVPDNGDEKSWQTITVPFDNKIKGVHALILKFSGEGFRVGSIQFKTAKD